MKTITYTLHKDGKTEVVPVTASNAMDGLSELAALGYSVRYPNWWIVSMDIQRKVTR